MMLEHKEKVFNDPVHGTIKLGQLLVKIIDTPEFQRLRHIKQLGGVYYVYPGAQHNRFEHSIGTAFLATKLVNHLKESQPELGIDGKDILCVKIAGLCHDMGHGPFSHLFDGAVLPRQLGDAACTHESLSCKMFDRVMNGIDHCLEEDDIIFVKELINGPTGKGEWPYRGRDVNKSFLFEIISNKENGVDVDKWDYFARDCHHLGIANGFDHNRLIQFTKVLENPETQRRSICFRDKEVFNLYDMFHTRFSLHKRAYQHKTVNAVEMLIRDVLCAADQYIMIPSNDKSSESCRMSECAKKENLGSYCNLDDRILQRIEHSDDPKLEKAKSILKRMSNGDSYKCIGRKIFLVVIPQRMLDEEKIHDEVTSERQQYVKAKHKTLKNSIKKYFSTEMSAEFERQIEVSIITFNYGRKEKDPIQSCWFYTKEEPTIPIRIRREDVSTLLPSNFQEYEIQVFCKKENLTKDESKRAMAVFNEWCKDIINELLKEEN